MSIAVRSELSDLEPAAFDLRAEQLEDVAAREALLDLAMGPGRTRKASEAIRRGRNPAEGLSLVAVDQDGHLVGTVRLWHVDAGGREALLLGPLAVLPTHAGLGLGSALMRQAIALSAQRHHGAILLVGDAPYYERFGFHAGRTGALAMPGPFEKHRLLALELKPGALDGAQGTIRGTGRRRAAPQTRAA
ncbi:GNAT family N-acetyltransferase [Aureimonas frigidaquae]|uniref:GNAT family N-acetyltransferase n=1 Tax=Aureimonas frigidaquae TaxID=424757 RepID=UPI0007865496|nr:N-acetyltransferase [Aureimonas frigidaquae]